MLCDGCGSTWRLRAISLSLLAGLGYEPQALADVQPNWSRRGVGISDHMALAASLAARFDYTNTYYHRYPFLDLLSIPDGLEDELEFVVCSDVLEHVPFPAERALRGLYDLLAPGGVAVISVPVAEGGPTHEYYPDLVSWELRGEAVWWTDSAGNEHEDPNPEFHGGHGQTLAFRLWSAPGLREALAAVGFSDLREAPNEPTLGVPPIRSPGVVSARR